MCVLNGCFKKEKDHYTFISPRGKSVVEFFVVPHECLQYCREFHTIDIIEKTSKTQNCLDALYSKMCKTLFTKWYTKCKSDKYSKRINFQLFKI